MLMSLHHLPQLIAMSHSESPSATFRTFMQNVELASSPSQDPDPMSQDVNLLMESPPQYVSQPLPANRSLTESQIIISHEPSQC